MLISPVAAGTAASLSSTERMLRPAGKIARRMKCRLGLALLIGGCWMLGLVAPSRIFATEPAQYDQLVKSYQNLFQKPDSARQSHRPFIKAQVQYAGTRADVTLRLDYTTHIIPADPASGVPNDQSIRLRSYNGSMVGPTIRVRPGAHLEIKLENKLPANEPNAPCLPHPANMDVPHGFNCTNLHTHGLHVSPEGLSDNVFKEIEPGAKPYKYEYDIPPDHVPGTFWYHPHKHGSVALQVTCGLAGALIVEGGLDEIPEIQAALERIMVFQQITFRPNPGHVVTPQPTDVYRGNVPPGEPPAGPGKAAVVTLINGQLHPVIQVAPGSVERWRFIHAGIQAQINVAVVKDDLQLGDPGAANYVPLYEIAVDGIPRGKMVERPNYPMYPGYRWDVLFKAPDEPGEYFLVGDQTPLAQQVPDRLSPAREYLAKIVVAGSRHPMRLPQHDELAACVPKQFAPITKEETSESDGRQRVCAIELFRSPGNPPPGTTPSPPTATPPAKPAFLIDKCEYDPCRIDRVAWLNRAEEWHVTGNGHPFHIHVNPFEQLFFDENHRVVDRIWRDTLYVNSPTPAIIRLRFKDFPGKTVLHCHILDHEDQGMMEKFLILREHEPLGNRKVRVLCSPQVVQQCVLPAPAPAPPKVGTKAPQFELPGTDGRTHRLADLSGRNVVVLVFFRGLGCLHCVEQLQALRELEPRFRKQNVTVVGVSSDSADALSTAYRSYARTQSLPILLLADGDLRAFKAFGCWNGEPQHGTYVLDGQQRIAWENVGPQPFMDLEAVLKRCQELQKRPTQLTGTN